MTKEEASEKYCIPIKILKEYESMELCKTVKRVMGEWHYDDEDIKRLSMIMTLYETDFSKEDIDELWAYLAKILLWKKVLICSSD